MRNDSSAAGDALSISHFVFILSNPHTLASLNPPSYGGPSRLRRLPQTTASPLLYWCRLLLPPLPLGAHGGGCLPGRSGGTPPAGYPNSSPHRDLGWSSQGRSVFSLSNFALASIRLFAAGVAEAGPNPKRGRFPFRRRTRPLSAASSIPWLPPKASGRSCISFRGTSLHSVVMVPPVHQESSIMPINTRKEGEFKLEEKELLCTKKPKFTGSIVQAQQEIEVLATEINNKGHGEPSLKESAYVVQSNGEANGCSEGHVHGSTNKELAARSRLAQLCSAVGWKHPTYDFEEQGLHHTKLFTCKATVHVETLTDTVLECLSEPKPQKKAAQEEAAQGVLWCLKCLGHVK